MISENGSHDLESHTKSRKSRGSNLCVHLKNTPEAAQAIRNMHIRKAAEHLKGVTLHKQRAPLLAAMVEVGGVPRPHSGAGHTASGPKRALNFAAHA